MQQRVTVDNVRGTVREILYAADATTTSIAIDTGEDDPDNPGSFINTLATVALPASGSGDVAAGTAGSVGAVTVTIIDIETDTGTDDDGDANTTADAADDVATRTTTTTVYRVTVTKAGTDAVEDDVGTTDVDETVTYGAPEGTLEIETTTTVVVSHPGQATELTLTLADTDAIWETVVAREPPATSDESDPVTVDFNTPDGSVSGTPSNVTSWTDNEVEAGDTTWAFNPTTGDGEVTVTEVETTTSPGEPIEVKGGVGLVSGGVEEKVDER